MTGERLGDQSGVTGTQPRRREAEGDRLQRHSAKARTLHLLTMGSASQLRGYR